MTIMMTLAIIMMMFTRMKMLIMTNDDANAETIMMIDDHDD